MNKGSNPRVQCHDCGKWMRVHSDKGQLFFGGDSACGYICIYCIAKHQVAGTYKVDHTNCKRNCAVKPKLTKVIFEFSDGFKLKLDKDKALKILNESQKL